MAQQVGSAVGLAAFNVIAVGYAHGTRVADRLAGLQAATLGTAALALATAVLAGAGPVGPPGRVALMPAPPGRTGRGWGSLRRG